MSTSTPESHRLPRVLATGPLAAPARAGRGRAAAEARRGHEDEERRAFERSRVLEALEAAGLLDDGIAERLDAQGPLVLFAPEDRRACALLGRRNPRAAAAVRRRLPATPAPPEAFPASVRAHSALLTAMASTAPLTGCDTAGTVRLAQADPDAVRALAAWVERAAAERRHSETAAVRCPPG